MPDDVEALIASLRERIRYYDRKYYLDAAPEISDLEYDRLMDSLRQYENDHPELVTPDSPTQRVGEQPVDHLQQVEHRVPMLSIDNTYSLEELSRFGERIKELLDGEEIEWIVELKIDGVAATLIYENGLLVRGLTRGNGTVGDDITHNLRTLQDVPLKLASANPPSVLEVRGEVFMNNEDLVALNQRQAENDLPAFANTRNVAAGTIRLLDPRICAERNLKMYCHGIGLCEGLASDNHMDFLTTLGEFGLRPTPMVECFPTFADAVAHCEVLIERIPELDFEIDGIVLKVNRFEQRERLGARSKSPRWIVAYKWEKYEAVTRVNDISVQVGKTGAVTPVAELEPVQLAGTTVSRASLHNAEEIERLDVRVNDTVVVEKAGKIIPHIVRVEKHERKPGTTPYVFPTACPVCDSQLAKDPDGVYIRCLNPGCEKKLIEQIKYFATRDAMDIEGLGDKVVEQLVSSGLVSGFAGIYQLTLDDLTSLDRMGTRSASKLIAAIESSKTRGLARLLNALSIRHVGKTVAGLLAAHFQSMAKLRAADLETLNGIDEVGEIIAESVYEFVRSDYGSQTIDELQTAGIVMEADAPEPTLGNALAGKSLVVTGTLTRFSRNEIHALIEKHGGKASSSVSSKTDYLIAGEKAGSKLEKASQLGVEILTEHEFELLIQ